MMKLTIRLPFESKGTKCRNIEHDSYHVIINVFCDYDNEGMLFNHEVLREDIQLNNYGSYCEEIVYNMSI